MKKEEKIEKAKKFLRASIKKSGKNTKPVIRHSLEVGQYLDKAGYSDEIIIAGLLHDILEDTEVAGQEIERDSAKKFLSWSRLTRSMNQFQTKPRDTKSFSKDAQKPAKPL